MPAARVCSTHLRISSGSGRVWSAMKAVRLEYWQPVSAAQIYDSWSAMKAVQALSAGSPFMQHTFETFQLVSNAGRQALSAGSPCLQHTFVNFQLVSDGGR